MAGQCPRGRPGATWEGLHRSTTGSTALGASTGMHTHQLTTSVMHSMRQEEVWRGDGLGGDRVAKTREGSSHRSPRRGSGRRIYSVEKEEGAEGSILPKLAVAESAEGSRNRQATARRLGLRRSQSAGKRGEREGLGWVSLTDPDPSRLGSTSREGWVGPVGQSPFVYLNQIQISSSDLKI
jgi:hypothetical protein